MWGLIFFYACHLGGFAHHDEDGDAGDGLPTTAEEDVVLLSSLWGGTVGITEVAGDLGDGGVTQRDEALLAPLALYAQIALVEEEVGEGQVTQLAHTQAAAEEHLDDGTIALTLDTALAPCGLDDAVDLGGRQHGREIAPPCVAPRGVPWGRYLHSPRGGDSARRSGYPR